MRKILLMLFFLLTIFLHSCSKCGCNKRTIKYGTGCVPPIPAPDEYLDWCGSDRKHGNFIDTIQECGKTIVRETIITC